MKSHVSGHMYPPVKITDIFCWPQFAHELVNEVLSEATSWHPPVLFREQKEASPLVWEPEAEISSGARMWHVRGTCGPT